MGRVSKIYTIRNDEQPRLSSLETKLGKTGIVLTCTVSRNNSRYWRKDVECGATRQRYKRKITGSWRFSFKEKLMKFDV